MLDLGFRVYSLGFTKKFRCFIFEHKSKAVTQSRVLGFTKKFGFLIFEHKIKAFSGVFRVYGLGFRVLWFGVWGLWFWVLGLWFMVYGFRV